MSEKQESWEKTIRAMLKPLEESLGKLSSDVTALKEQVNPRSSGGGGEETPIYKCKGKDCGFATDDLSDFVAHTVKENIPKAEAKPEETETPPKKRHETVSDYLNCPECRPRFDEHYKKEGWTPPKREGEKKAEEDLAI